MQRQTSIKFLLLYVLLMKDCSSQKFFCVPINCFWIRDNKYIQQPSYSNTTTLKLYKHADDTPQFHQWFAKRRFAYTRASRIKTQSFRIYVPSSLFYRTIFGPPAACIMNQYNFTSTVRWTGGSNIPRKTSMSRGALSIKTGTFQFDVKRMIIAFLILAF